MILMAQHVLPWSDRHPFTAVWLMLIAYTLLIATAGAGGWPL